MNKLKKKRLDVQLNAKIEFTGKKCDGITPGRVYFVTGLKYDNGLRELSMTFLDDDMDEHWITQTFFNNNFKIL